MAKKQNLEQIARYADMLSAMGTEPRLRIMQLLPFGPSCRAGRR